PSVPSAGRRWSRLADTQRNPEPHNASDHSRGDSAVPRRPHREVGRLGGAVSTDPRPSECGLPRSCSLPCSCAGPPKPEAAAPVVVSIRLALGGIEDKPAFLGAVRDEGKLLEAELGK